MSTSLDDLLGHEEDPPPPQRRPTGRARVVLRTLVVSVAATAVVVAGLRAVGLQMSWYVIIAGVFALVAIRRAVARTAPPPPSRRGSSGDPGNDPAAGQDVLARAVARWEDRLSWSQGKRDRFTRQVVPALGALADERLRQRHGLTRQTDPNRARELLGDRLWTLLSSTARRPPPPRELAAIVAELEKI